METRVLGVLLKVVSLSTVMAIAIKVIGPLVPIPNSALIALLMVLSPTILMAGYLLLIEQSGSR